MRACTSSLLGRRRLRRRRRHHHSAQASGSFAFAKREPLLVQPPRAKREPLGFLEVTSGERYGIGQDGSGVGLGQERRSQRLDRHPVQFIRVLGLLEV